MTEAEWLSGTRSLAMLGFLIDLRGSGRYADRTYRLFACAVARWFAAPQLDRRSLAAVETAERFARGEATSHDLARARRDAHEAAAAVHGPGATGQGRPAEVTTPALCALAAAGERGLPAAWEAVQTVDRFGPARLLDDLPGLIRDVFGNPFHVPALPPHWRAWNEGTIARLARHVRDGRRFDEMPVLGDALEEAGCADEHVLGHCRGGPHGAGCWVLELLLAEP